MKKLFKILLIFSLLGIGNISSQVMQTKPELIPYRLVPSLADGYGCWLELEVIAWPDWNMLGLTMPQVEETKEIIFERMVFEETNRWAMNDLFEIDGVLYLLLKVETSNTINDWGWERLKYETLEGYRSKGSE